ncbi:hypothetical protein H0H81_009978 [Sphagnurus paluster]|uniref:C3H1-type domain-containing protein n=1 Tax=Sphagnurus paluster TaxID=117069 RepID=A0A9P7FTA7_9AGAR|nr:hypothetical protein H0H81_009978 [Sphagnurus paluster]
MGVYRSPASTPSISSSIPFDWNAARSRKPPPYGMPLQNKTRKSTSTPAKRVVRKKGIIERITSIPSTIAFEIALFPNNVPLPSPKTSGRLVGGGLHLLHLCVRVSQIRKVPDSDVGWEDMYREGEGTSWFDWVCTLCLVRDARLIGRRPFRAALLNAVYLFTRIRVYRLHQRSDPVSSPNARFVSAELDFEPLETPSLAARMRTQTGYAFSYSWRWLLNLKPPTRPGQATGRMSRVQQLDLHAMSYWYETLVKDREIIAAEVMSEYNEGFVYPRVNPVRRDVAVMTHESEIVNVWERRQSYLEDGQPRKEGGCFMGRDCRFVHPTDPDWHDADIPTFFDRTPARYRRRSPSPRRRASDYSLPPPSSALSTRPPPASASTLPPPPTASTAASPPPPSPAMQPPPPTPSLPPLPAPPSFLSRKPDPQPESSPEELKSIWAERIKLLADCVTARQQVSNIEADVASIERLIHTNGFEAFPDEDKRRIEGERAALVTKRDDIRKRRDDAIAVLINTRSWPAAPITGAEQQENEKLHDMLKHVAELQATAAEINSLFTELREQDDPSATGDSTPMDVDPDPQAQARPLKRRRLAGNRVDTQHGPTQVELEEVRDKLAELEGHYATFQNDMFAHAHEQREDMEERLETRVEEMKEYIASLPPAAPQDAYKEVRENIDLTGSQVEELAKTVGELFLSVDAQNKEISGLKLRIDQSHAEMAQMREQFKDLLEAHPKNQKRIEALEAGIDAYMNSPPAVPQPNLTHEQLVHLLEEPLVDMVRENIRPLVEQLRDLVQQLLRQQNEEMYKALWGKLSLTLHMVETVSQRMDLMGRLHAQTSAQAPGAMPVQPPAST